MSEWNERAWPFGSYSAVKPSILTQNGSSWVPSTRTPGLNESYASSPELQNCPPLASTITWPS